MWVFPCSFSVCVSRGSIGLDAIDTYGVRGLHCPKYRKPGPFGESLRLQPGLSGLCPDLQPSGQVSVTEVLMSLFGSSDPEN